MSWQIEIARDARKELARLQPQMQARISKAILALEANPFPSGCKKLKNRDGFRIRVEDYRVLYFADAEIEENYGRPSFGIVARCIAIDRLCMMLLDQESIRDVILFPQMKPK